MYYVALKTEPTASASGRSGTVTGNVDRKGDWPESMTDSRKLETLGRCRIPPTRYKGSSCVVKVGSTRGGYAPGLPYMDTTKSCIGRVTESLLLTVNTENINVPDDRLARSQAFQEVRDSACTCVGFILWVGVLNCRPTRSAGLCSAS